MARLSRYLLKLFVSEAMALFVIAAFLLFLIQCLRLFDIVENKGQSLLTLLGQAALGMPGLGIVFLYVCLGIGLGRALRNLQGSSELQIIHVSRLLPALLQAVGVYTVGGALAVLLLAHIVDPVSVRATNDWSASIAADLVSRSMIPHQFTQLVDGVSMVIGSRDAEGNITDFFADDSRDPKVHRTYFAKTALIIRDPQGFVLRMQNGAVQSMNPTQQFSQVSFSRYDLALDNLTGSTADTDPLAQTSSLDLLATGLSTGQWDPDAVKTLAKRSGEALRVIAMCVFVTGLAAFPSGRRARFEVPLEFAVLGMAFLERAITSYAPGPSLVGVAFGSILLLGYGIVVLAWRLRLFRRVPRLRRQPA
ncbi:MAG TPA: LptF/LptG family permease [Devosia sp.]|nr:LptF/LptG family permease [Devosia sp.]